MPVPCISCVIAVAFFPVGGRGGKWLYKRK